MQPVNLLSFSLCGSICSTGLLAQPQSNRGARGRLEKHLSANNKATAGDTRLEIKHRVEGWEPELMSDCFLKQSPNCMWFLSARPSATLKLRREAETRACRAPLDQVMASAGETEAAPWGSCSFSSSTWDLGTIINVYATRHILPNSALLHGKDRGD